MRIRLGVGVALAIALASGLEPRPVSASMVVSQWYFGSWQCRIDGRPARMVWKVVDDPQTQCGGGVCSSTSGVRVVGWFSDNGGPWVPLKVRWHRGDELGIRYLGGEPDDWFLRREASQSRASGWTTWRGRRYSLDCSSRR